MHWVGTVDRRGYGDQQKLFVTLMDCVSRFDTHRSQFFAEFDWFIVLTSGLDTYISRYGDFCANNDDNDDDTTNYFTPWAGVWSNKYCGYIESYH